MNIILNRDSEILYGSDQAYISYPTRIATVGLFLETTEDLLTAANRLRVVEGYDPVEEFDFTIGLNDFTATHLDNCVEAVVTDTSAPDVDERYTIDLSEEEQRAIFRTLDIECRAKLGRGCEDLLAEARERMRPEEKKTQLKSLGISAMMEPWSGDATTVLFISAPGGDGHERTGKNHFHGCYPFCTAAVKRMALSHGQSKPYRDRLQLVFEWHYCR